MTQPDTRIRDAVTDIQGWLAHTPLPGEAVVRQAIVLRLLDAAGFDIWNPGEVVPEETNATGNRADFLIRVGEGKFALEIKGMNVALNQSHYQQAATYAVNEGTRWAVVTNGRVWIVIDEHLPGRWQEREALKLELGQEDFAGDLAHLFDPEAWRKDRFSFSLESIKTQQNWRQDVERTRKEKRPVVEEVQQNLKSQHSSWLLTPPPKCTASRKPSGTFYGACPQIGTSLSGTHSHARNGEVENCPCLPNPAMWLILDRWAR